MYGFCIVHVVRSYGKFNQLVVCCDIPEMLGVSPPPKCSVVVFPYPLLQFSGGEITLYSLLLCLKITRHKTFFKRLFCVQIVNTLVKFSKLEMITVVNVNNHSTIYIVVNGYVSQ